MAMIAQLDRGCYEAARAAALSGVPERTVYSWAERSLVVPSVSARREKLWSYGDLLTLRLVDWLRHPKGEDQAGAEIARSSMTEIRAMLERAGDDLWRPDASGRVWARIMVTAAGKIHFDDRPVYSVHGQTALEGMLDLFAPFHTGPDLRRPRPSLRIVPGKVAGEPHLAHSRLTTRTVAALIERGFTLAQVGEMYPDEDLDALGQASDLEKQLAAA